MSVVATGCYRGPLQPWLGSSGESHGWTRLPGGPDARDVDVRGWRTGDTVPDGVSNLHWGGRHEITPMGPRAFVASVEDDSIDLLRARIHVNGIPLWTATRANGRIVDRGAFATATLPFFLPPVGSSYTVKLSWTGFDGRTQSSSTSFRKNRFPGRD